jgi:quercetin dioxygenase-like cupin family protein
MFKYHKDLDCFPQSLKNRLSKASSDVSDNLSGWVVGNEKAQVVFWEINEGFSVEPHSHDHDEWGIIVSGYCILTIEGETKQYNTGEEFYIPSGLSHYATMSSKYRAIDFFASPDWVKVEK